MEQRDFESLEVYFIPAAAGKMGSFRVSIQSSSPVKPGYCCTVGSGLAPTYGSVSVYFLFLFFIIIILFYFMFLFRITEASAITKITSRQLTDLGFNLSPAGGCIHAVLVPVFALFSAPVAIFTDLQHLASRLDL